MAVIPRPFPPALSHGDFREVLPGLHLVTGTVPLPGRLPVRFSRNMTAIVEGDRVILVNTMRLTDAGLAALDKLGKVTDVIRLAGNHGMDDPFYADHYGARVWAVKGQRYTPGFGRSEHTYFEPHEEIDASTKLPIEGASLFTIRSKPTEGLLVLTREGGVCIAGDCLQNWGAPDAYFSLMARVMMRAMGFIKPHNVGPAWLKQCKPPKEDLVGALDLAFDNVLPAHGAPVIGGAKDKYRPAITRASA